MPTKVLIVAKTRQGSRACIGGITFDGRSVRLVAANAATDEAAGMDYAVGEVWEVTAEPAEHLIPPHVENVIVRAKRCLGPMTDPVPFIKAHMPPATGGIEVLYEGLAQSTASGALYIAERSGIPHFSTMFWRPDRPLARTEASRRIHYRYATAPETSLADPAPSATVPPPWGHSLTFVGFQEPVAVIPAGTLLRVSLAHWWRPPGDEESEPRCYLQLSGWFLPEPAGGNQAGARYDAPARGQVSRRNPVTAPLLPEERAATGAAAARSSRPALGDAQRLLKSVFGYDSFRPLQADVVANILAGRDSLVIMPTGSGKSLCYQLPALLFDGLTVVVSPLIALMQDQVAQLRALGVPAAFLNSTLDFADYRTTVAAARQGEIKLLYTSPETLLRPETLVLLDQCRVACLAIDEAHCISAWGHDFRPEYRQLTAVRDRFPSAACVAFTATATERVRRDIGQILGLAPDSAFITSFNRANLYLAAQPRTAGPGQAFAFLEAHREQSGIIYCSTRAGVDRLAASLQARGWQAVPYHAGMEDDARRRNQDLFVRDRAPIIVATIAFGMGINKSNVRFVLHYNLPQSLENYYQEIGRAGRDGLRADCLLLYSRADMQTLYRFIEEGAEAERAGRHARLQAMVRYAEAGGCRRALLLQYFDEQPAVESCGFCDNCLSARSPEGETENASEAARLFLGCVQGTGQVFGAAHIINILRGSRAAAVLERHHDRLPQYGAGREQPSEQWRRYAEQFIRQGLLQQDMEHGGLRLTGPGRAVLGGASVLVPAAVPRRATPAAAAGLSAGTQGAAAALAAAEHDSALFERLRALRRQIADESDLPPYVIFSDRSLVEMATRYPQSAEAFLAIYGVGEHKLAQYGERFLAVLRAHAAEHGLAEQAPAPPGSAPYAPPPAGPGERSVEVGRLFAAGSNVPELQALYGVARSTIVNHLYRCAAAGRRFAPERVLTLSGLTAGDQERVLAAFEGLGASGLRPIFDALNGEIPYEELHILRLYYLCAR